MTSPIDVIVLRNGRVVARAEADGPENAIYAGQVLHDEAHVSGFREKIVVGFYVDDKLVIQYEGRPRYDKKEEAA